MNEKDKRPNFFVREIPFIVLLVFWIIYTGIEIIRDRLDLLASVVPTGLFIVAYIIARLAAKGQAGQR